MTHLSNFSSFCLYMDQLGKENIEAQRIMEIYEEKMIQNNMDGFVLRSDS